MPSLPGLSGRGLGVDTSPRPQRSPRPCPAAAHSARRPGAAQPCCPPQLAPGSPAAPVPGLARQKPYGPARPSVRTAAQADSAASQISGQVSSWWQAYSRRLEADPVRTKAVTSFFGFVIGDFLAQRIGGEPFSILRGLRLGCYGLFLDGPIGHWWYKVLDKYVLPDRPKSTEAVLIKTAADQLVWAPIMTVVFFVVLKSLEGHPELIMDTIQDKLVKTVVANYILWPGAHFINFKFVPTEHRILYNNCVSVIWNMYLSTLSHATVIDPVQLLDHASNAASSLGLTGSSVVLPPFERLLPEGATFPTWFHNPPALGPIQIAPFERLLPQGTGLGDFKLSIPSKIVLAPTRALYPMWLQPLIDAFP